MTNKIFQILRNSSVYNDYTTAAAAFNVPADVTGLIDGQLKSARYVDSDTEKAIIGIWNSTTEKWSMIDIESSLLHAVLNANQINVTDPSSNETKALDEVIFENETVTAAALNDLNEKIKAIENANFGDSINNAISTAAEDASTKANAAKEAAIYASKVTLVHDDGTLIYTLYQGTDNNKSEIGKINIPKDMVVESGSVITATNDDKNNDSTVAVGKKYIKLVVTNVEKPLYIAVNDLYKDHTAAENAKEVQVAISDNNVISAKIVNVDASKVALNDSKGTNLQEALTTINSTLNSKQDVINDLPTIRSNADEAASAYNGLRQIADSVTRDVSSLKAADQTNSSAITAIEGKIPVAATSENQLADKDFVNSSIATATATFIGTFNIITDLGGSERSTHKQIQDLLDNSVCVGVDDNDYCFVLIPTSSSTPEEIARIERYKATKGTDIVASWRYEYTLNNSGFTADQWAAINSHITSGLVTKLNNLPDNAALTILFNGKQDIISDLSTIRSGAAAGATALQPSALNDFYTKSQVESLLAFEVAEGSMSAKLCGTRNVVSGEASASTGQDNNVSGVNAFALGEYNSASGMDSFVHGKMTEATGNKSHAEGNGTRAKGPVSHAEGSVTISNGDVSHSEGYGTVAHDMSHSEGIGAIVFKIKSLNDSDPIYKVISGVDTLSNIFKGFFIATVVTNDINKTSCAQITNIEVKEENAELGITSEEAGIYITTDINLLTDPSNETRAYILVNSAFTAGSHIEGYYNVSGVLNGFKSFINSYIHNYFDNFLINKIYGGHVEGIGNIIGGKYSHAEGALNSTNNAIVHIEGKGNIANADYQHVEGKFNEPDNTAAHIIGNGTDNEHRSNAATVDWEGNLKIKGNLKDSQGNIIDTTKYVVVNDHSGAGDDPSKIYIPSAESHKQLYDGLIEDEKVIAEAITRVHESLDDHLKLTDIHLTESLLTDIHNNTEKNTFFDKIIFNGHEYLDLHLPSGNLWATMNLGATRVEEEGYHFMWGNTTQLASENDAIWSNCKYSNDGVKFAAKYNSHVNDNNYYHNSDIKFVVEPNDDPARKLWGGLWRMPTIDDLIELFDNLHSPSIETINGVEVLSFQPKNNSQDPFFYIPFCSYWENGVIHNYTDENNNKGCVIANSDITGIDDLTSTVLIKGDTFTKNYAFPISAITGLCIRPVINLNK